MKEKWYKTHEIEPTADDADEHGFVLAITLTPGNKVGDQARNLISDWHKVRYEMVTKNSILYYWNHAPKFDIWEQQ
jgi:hypothetical protein